MPLGSDRVEIELIELTIQEGEEVYPSATSEMSQDVEMITDQFVLLHPEATVGGMSIAGLEIGVAIGTMLEEVDHAHQSTVMDGIEAPVQGGGTQMKI